MSEMQRNSARQFCRIARLTQPASMYLYSKADGDLIKIKVFLKKLGKLRNSASTK